MLPAHVDSAAVLPRGSLSASRLALLYRRRAIGPRTGRPRWPAGSPGFAAAAGRLPAVQHDPPAPRQARATGPRAAASRLM